MKGEFIYDNNVVRPEEPKEAVDQVYCIYYDDGEMTISQNEIEPETRLCSNKMITARFVEAVKPKSCYYWFRNCTDLTEIKKMKNLYTNECTDMEGMFYN